MRRKLTPAFIKSPPPPAGDKDREIYWDTIVLGFGMVVMRDGRKSWCVQYRAGRRSRRMHIKAVLSLQAARKYAKQILGEAAKGNDPLAERRRANAASVNTLKAVAEEFHRKEGGRLRTGEQRHHTMVRLVFPKFGSRPIAEIRRSEIVSLLDTVEEESGPHQAQSVLTFLRALFNWHEGRDDDFVSPIRRGMSRTKLSESARDRILTDAEIQRVWKAAGATPPPYGPLVKFALLTAARRQEAAGMTRDELVGPDWIVAAGRMKSGLEHVVPLSKAARAVLDGMPNLAPFVFSLDGRRPTRNFAVYKARLDKDSGVTGWRLHDLRRTARSLMSRAGVLPDTAERCLAHAMGGVRGIYDRHSFHAEKADAFEKLAALVDRIVSPAVV